MHKQQSPRISLLLILVLGAVLLATVNAQRGSPITSYFGRGSPPPTQGLGYPQQSQSYSPYKKPGKPTGPNLIGWLGSQMAKFPSFSRSPRPSYPFPQQKYKQQVHGGGKLPVIFSSSGKYGGSSVVNSVHGGEGVSHIYMPPGSTTPSASMTPQNTIFQIISADGSSRYQASPPPGYENFFSGGEGGSSPQQGQFSRPPPPPPQRPSLPVHSMDQVVQQQGQFGQVVYHNAGQQPLYGAKAAGNIELIPSKMVSYEKQILSTGHPEYQASLDGMVTSASSNGYPVYYQQQQQQQQQQPQQYPHPSLPGNYEYRGQQVQRIDENLGSMLNGVSPDIAPIYDLSSLHGQEQQQQQQVVAAPSHQGPIYAQPPQQQQDMQAAYSHQSPAAMSVVQPPSNFQYQSQQDLQVAESNNQQQQVQIVNHGAADGNPTFEVFADANAPTYDGGHPFDINQLISMIEPGAQVDPKDIVSEDQENAASNSNPAYAPQQQEFLPQYDPTTQVQQ